MRRLGRGDEKLGADDRSKMDADGCVPLWQQSTGKISVDYVHHQIRSKNAGAGRLYGPAGDHIYQRGPVWVWKWGAGVGIYRRQRTDLRPA